MEFYFQKIDKSEISDFDRMKFHGHLVESLRPWEDASPVTPIVKLVDLSNQNLGRCLYLNAWTEHGTEHGDKPGTLLFSHINEIKYQAETCGYKEVFLKKGIF